MTSTDLTQYLETQDDFNLELFVYRTAKELGFEASHGGTYEDPITNKPRQYDVRAHILGGKHRIDLAIECKSLKPSYPLLLFRIPRTPAESFHEVIISYEKVRSFAGSALHFDPAHNLCPAESLRLDFSMYRTHQFVGKATAQVGRNDRGDFVTGDSDAYEKWSQALSSAHGLAMAAIRHYEKYGVPAFVTFVLPVLVVSDDTLWAADYSDDGVLKGPPQKIDEGLLFVDRHCSERMSLEYTISHLYILTRSTVPTFLRQIAKDPDETLWKRVFPKQPINEFLARHK